MPTQHTLPFTVVLCWPIYIGDYTPKISTHHVFAKDYSEAVWIVQRECFEDHTRDGSDLDTISGPKDFYPAVVFKGHHHNLFDTGDEDNA